MSNTLCKSNHTSLNQHTYTWTGSAVELWHLQACGGLRTGRAHFGPTTYWSSRSGGRQVGMVSWTLEVRIGPSWSGHLVLLGPWAVTREEWLPVCKEFILEVLQDVFVAGRVESGRSSRWTDSWKISSSDSCPAQPDNGLGKYYSNVYDGLLHVFMIALLWEPPVIFFLSDSSVPILRLHVLLTLQY